MCCISEIQFPWAAWIFLVTLLYSLPGFCCFLLRPLEVALTFDTVGFPQAASAEGMPHCSVRPSTVLHKVNLGLQGGNSFVDARADFLPLFLCPHPLVSQLGVLYRCKLPVPVEMTSLKLINVSQLQLQHHEVGLNRPISQQRDEE